MYSADGAGTGNFVYGHYGRLSDLHNFKVKHGINFTGSVIVLRTRSSLYHVGSMVRNAELFGASAVVLFPDPISYIITEKGDVGKSYFYIIYGAYKFNARFRFVNFHSHIAGHLPENISLRHSVKFAPGDPTTPYITDPSSNISYGKDLLFYHFFVDRSKSL